PQELAEELNVPVVQVRDGLDCGSAYDGVSMHSPAGRDSTAEIADYFGEDDHGLDTADDRVILRPLLRKLPRRQRQILVMRFADDLSQSQIGEQLGVSQMHVSRLLRKTLTTLRNEIDA
ncbi:MAG: sigma-70 family RNA polymerase sigma factor, partial [Paeniglutamicibacter sp.]